MKIYLLNDTSECPHVGCHAVMRSLRQRLHGHEIVGSHLAATTRDRYFGDADLVICNGQGAMHHGMAAAAYLIESLREAQAQRRATALTNATWDTNPEDWGDVLSRCSRVGGRDPWSTSQMTLHAEGVFSTMNPDLSLDEIGVPLLYGPHRGRVVLGHPGARGDVGNVFCGLAKAGHPRVDMTPPGTLQNVVDDLAGCACYVTGQFHGVIAALVAGCPFVAVRSNSHKIDSLLDWLHLDALCTNGEDIEDRIEEAKGRASLFSSRGVDFMNLPRLPDLGKW